VCLKESLSCMLVIDMSLHGRTGHLTATVYAGGIGRREDKSERTRGAARIDDDSKGSRVWGEEEDDDDDDDDDDPGIPQGRSEMACSRRLRTCLF